MTPRLATPPAIRIRPAPPCDPPFDDERHPEDVWTVPVQPLWELAPDPGPDRPAVPRRQAAAEIPAEIRTMAARFVNSCLEVVNGLRPIGQLRKLADPLEAATILSTMTRAARRLQREARRHRPAPGGGTAKLKLRRMRVCQPHADAVEIAAVIGTGERAWAATFRLVRRNRRWLCTAANVL